MKIDKHCQELVETTVDLNQATIRLQNNKDLLYAPHGLIALESKSHQTFLSKFEDRLITEGHWDGESRFNEQVLGHRCLEKLKRDHGSDNINLGSIDFTTLGHDVYGINLTAHMFSFSQRKFRSAIAGARNAIISVASDNYASICMGSSEHLEALRDFREFSYNRRKMKIDLQAQEDSVDWLNSSEDEILSFDSTSELDLIDLDKDLPPFSEDSVPELICQYLDQQTAQSSRSISGIGGSNWLRIMAGLEPFSKEKYELGLAQLEGLDEVVEYRRQSARAFRLLSQDNRYDWFHETLPSDQVHNKGDLFSFARTLGVSTRTGARKK